MPDANVNSSDAKHWFTTTHWSVVLAAADPTTPQAHEALGALCRIYWRPLYGYACGNCRCKEDAEDLTQEFFARLLEKNTLGFADRKRGKFRSFLLTALKNFMADEWKKARAQKRGGNVAFISFEDPQLQGLANSKLTSGSDLVHRYDRQWAMAILAEARRLLQEEYGASGRADDLEVLAPCVFLGESRHSYPELAVRLNKSEAAVRQDVKRLRERYREKVRQAVANTVADLRDVDAELRHLFSIINQ